MTQDIFTRWDPWWWYRDMPSTTIAASAHYAIYTGDRCIDIISTDEPRFILLQEFASGRNQSERPERVAETGKS